MSVLTTSVK